MTNKPETIINDLNEKIFKLSVDSKVYLSESSPQFLSLFDEATVLGKVNAAERLILLVRLYGLSCNRAKVEYYFRNAIMLHADEVRLNLAKITAFIMMGYYSETIALIDRCGDTDINQMNLFLNSPPVQRPLHLLDRFHKRATAMNLAHTPEFRPEIAQSIQIMDYWGDTDEDYSAVFDIAGEVLRSRKIVLPGIPADHYVCPVPAPKNGGPPFLKCVFVAPVDLETSIDMTCEFCDKLAESGIKIPQSLIFEFIPK